MGGLNSKDSKVAIFMKGYVEGEVYLDVKADRLYRSLSIQLVGQESIIFGDPQDNIRNQRNRMKVYQNSCENYRDQFVLAQFSGTLKEGQYVFPFSILLPSMMTGSFYVNRNCYLKYALKAVLAHQTSENKNQVYELNLNLLEPPRSPLQPISHSSSLQSFCCGCCFSYGVISTTLRCNKNFVLSGDSIHVDCLIDNTNGSTKIESAVVVLKQCRICVASDTRTTDYRAEKSFVLNSTRTPTAIGCQQKFSFDALVPNEIIDSTAIGRIIARYFVLQLYTTYGCCTSTVGNILHLIVQSRTPVLMRKQQISQPPNWNPHVHPKVVCSNMRPYVYVPLAQIPFLNLPPNTRMPNLVEQDKMHRSKEMNSITNKGNLDTGKSSEEGYQPYFKNDANQTTQTNLMRDNT